VATSFSQVFSRIPPTVTEVVGVFVELLRRFA
jgi:hypothetical protein